MKKLIHCCHLLMILLNIQVHWKASAAFNLLTRCSLMIHCCGAYHTDKL